LLPADEVIEYQKTVAMHGLSILARPSAVWVLRETTEWLRLPLQPITSNSGALLTFAHCPNFKLQAAQLGRHRTGGIGLSDHNGKV